MCGKEIHIKGRAYTYCQMERSHAGKCELAIKWSDIIIVSETPEGKFFLKNAVEREKHATESRHKICDVPVLRTP
ncbi:MAG: hypothetical protein C5B59_12380 [Bacteroidetes bacterium]|nr:MAG: hypothetical protein C5B59_12380 [Bacteroidota bacterium]